VESEKFHEEMHAQTSPATWRTQFSHLCFLSVVRPKVCENA
jgi:hypothetical protein